jgi:uncharacterized RDD family membrane protein YckC
MPAPVRQLDSRIEIVTPENIAFHYVLAGPFRRLPAYLIDVAIRLVALVAIGVAAAVAGIAGVGGLGIGVWLVSWFVLSWFYGGLFETLWNGQTPGKRLLGLRVLAVDGRPINALQAVLRNVLRDVDALPMIGYGGAAGIPLYMLGLVTMAANNRYQRLGDLACGTIVVVEKRSRLRGLAQIAHGEVLEFAQHLPPSFVAGQAMAQALSVYVGRRELFSPARRYELARTLAEPLCERLNLPAYTNPDLLLCALYYRAFIADRPGAGGDRKSARPPAEVLSR